MTTENIQLTKDLPSYEPLAIEPKWYELWEKAGCFQPDPKNNNKPPYCIVIPPPNVTGTLHMGHGFQHAIMDSLIRYHKMCGYNTLWQSGTDHAGIATQMVVEKRLQLENISRFDLGRKQFVNKIWEWKNYSNKTINKQLKRLGSSLDWSRERFTMDEGLSNAVKDVFIKLYKEDLIYRGKRLVSWDPILQTALSDLEVINEETNGSLWFINYLIKDSNDFVTVATTRPETIFGDVAIAIHPNDERYNYLIGKSVKVPLQDRYIPIIGDESVLSTFGSGCLKITPAHDFNDYKIAKTHNLPYINIFTKDAHLNNKVPLKYAGLIRTDARKKILADLKESNLLVKEIPHKLTIPIGERSGAIIEPLLTDQWFVKISPLAKEALKVVHEEKINFIPNLWINTYTQWLENAEDWCISRQLWWGHQIPAWYDPNNNIYVGNNEEDVRRTYKLSHDIPLIQDPDVLDTWFSSALWPFATLGWPEDTNEYKTFFPTNVLVTGFDIIFFWVARMIMLSLKFTKQIPFKEVYITGLIRDLHGQKMSKSKGNILDPLDIINGITLDDLLIKRTTNLMQDSLKENIIKNTKKEFPSGIPPHGCDALRFNFLALASTGRDIKFDMARLNGYRNFCNKLWNATKFVLLQCPNQHYSKPSDIKKSHFIDQWIISQLQQTIEKAHKYFATYRFDLLAQTLYDFIWDEYCAWYIELSKILLNNEHISLEQKNHTCYTLLKVLENITRLLHPITPFITEEIWQYISKKLEINGDFIIHQPYPICEHNLINVEVEEKIAWLKKIITIIRNMRSEKKIPPSAKIEVLLKNTSFEFNESIKLYSDFIKPLAKIEKIKIVELNTNIDHSIKTMFGNVEIHIILKKVTVDKQEEKNRISKLLLKLESEQSKLDIKINNTGFCQNAPQDVIAKEKERLANISTQLLQLKNQLGELN